MSDKRLGRQPIPPSAAASSACESVAAVPAELKAPSPLERAHRAMLRYCKEISYRSTSSSLAPVATGYEYIEIPLWAALQIASDISQATDAPRSGREMNDAQGAVDTSNNTAAEPETLGGRICMLRDARSLTTADVERGTGLSHATLWRVIKDSVCKVETLVAFAEFFDVTTDELLGRHSTPKRTAT